ncbi:hypothetical protein [Dysgonomonas sp. ZJ709]|uniref:hypothetical protein n=1 Tax=Dysgonomonas sp. ZJ709 TaxID=2709797 RepID=UPI0013EBE0C1|nr:hypothetical protein [Dysgonomonas sp. ZJ709]
MNFYKLTLITLFSLVIGFSFSSCDKRNDYWKAATLDFSAVVPVARQDGYFEQTIRIRNVDIQGYSPSREDMIDIRNIDSWLLLSNLTRLDRISFRIVLDGDTRVFYEQNGVSGDIQGEFIINNDVYYSLMTEVMNRIRYKGYVDITIVGNSNIGDGGPIEFNFSNNIDILIRD